MHGNNLSSMNNQRHSSIEKLQTQSLLQQMQSFNQNSCSLANHTDQKPTVSTEYVYNDNNNVFEHGTQKYNELQKIL